MWVHRDGVNGVNELVMYPARVSSRDCFIRVCINGGPRNADGVVKDKSTGTFRITGHIGPIFPSLISAESKHQT